MGFILLFSHDVKLAMLRNATEASKSCELNATDHHSVTKILSKGRREPTIPQLYVSVEVALDGDGS